MTYNVLMGMLNPTQSLTLPVSSFSVPFLSQSWSWSGLRGLESGLGLEDLLRRALLVNNKKNAVNSYTVDKIRRYRIMQSLLLACFLEC